MRAGRLISMVLILQRRGRVTAAQLSEEFGVSVRTVLRDVQALHEAGIPVYTSQGSGGGIELIGGYRTILTGMSVDEATAVFLLGQPALARSLGLATPAASARRKVLEALTPALRNQAESIDEWLLHDPTAWGPTEPLPLDRLGSAIRRRLAAVLAMPEVSLEVRPLGLVAKAGDWYLVHLTASGVLAMCLQGLSSVRITQTTFVRPADFDLATLWSGLTAAGRPASLSGAVPEVIRP